MSEDFDMVDEMPEEMMEEDTDLIDDNKGNQIEQPDYSEFTDEQLDEIADTSIGILQSILKFFEVGEITIDEYEGDEGELILDITGSDLAVLIGRHGNTLDALQTLFSAILVKKLGFRFPVIIDVEGYKSRQRQKLENIARNAATRAINQNRSIKLHPMSPYERRIIHITLRNNNKVETVSNGEGNNRYVTVVPK